MTLLFTEAFAIIIAITCLLLIFLLLIYGGFPFILNRRKNF
ncbi:hypothetical protein ZPR_1493 [Zunongwangia profunda SM-A87]|uniref:Uncharacterized protein n=1 Tax=Zunongwangia profunda (strain DSM 18752 / CCTCC AB 206139 / SM-A87) TaxID=655815 RepID=D5BKE8_ZUNPS|nr:hypothetical protein ZPR_1493 [Zunongwangia profunda SM-A87]